MYACDEVGRELSITHPGGRVVSRAYGDDYSAATDASGSVRTVWFDAWGRQTQVREVIGGVNKDTAWSRKSWTWSRQVSG